MTNTLPLRGMETRIWSDLQQDKKLLFTIFTPEELLNLFLPCHCKPLPFHKAFFKNELSMRTMGSRRKDLANASHRFGQLVLPGILLTDLP